MLSRLYMRDIRDISVLYLISGNSWGRDEFGQGLGHGPQEEFYGCADVAIIEEGEGSGTGEEGEEEDHEEGDVDDQNNEQGNGNDAGVGTPEEEDGQHGKWVPIWNRDAPTTGGAKCNATGLWTNAAGMNGWCQENCVHPNPNCPKDRCKCYEFVPENPEQEEKDEPENPEPKGENPDQDEQDIGTDDDPEDPNENPHIEQGGDHEPSFVCGFRNNAENDEALDRLCAPNCDHRTGTCTNTHCSCFQDCPRFVATGQYVGQEAMDMFCQFQCEQGNAACPRDLCACADDIQRLTCYGGSGLVASMPEFSKFCETMCAAGDGSLCPVDCICEIN